LFALFDEFDVTLEVATNVKVSGPDAVFVSDRDVTDPSAKK